MGVDKISGLGRFVGEVVKEKTPAEIKVPFNSSTPLNFQVKVGGRLMPNALVKFRLKGKTGNASLANDAMTAGDDGMVTVNVNAGSEAADFSVIASSDGKDVGTVRVLVVANIQAADGNVQVSFATNVPGPIALEVARLAKNDPRAALQLLAQHDPMVAQALQMGHGEAIQRIADPLELARTAIA